MIIQVIGIALIFVAVSAVLGVFAAVLAERLLGVEDDMLIYEKFRKPRYRGESIVDGLKKSNYGSRRKWPSNKQLFYEVGTLEEIAAVNGIPYDDPAVAHIIMLELLKQGALVRPAAITRLL